MQEQSIQQSPRQSMERASSMEVNVGQTERWLSMVGGGMLAIYALRQSLWSLAMIASGVALVRRGLSGHCALYDSMGVSTNHQAIDEAKTTTGRARQA